MDGQSWLEQASAALSAWLPEHVPRFVVAAGILLVGYLFARLVAGICRRVFRRWSNRLLGMFDKVTRRRGVQARADRGDAETVAVNVGSRVVFWLVFALALAAATSVLGVPVLSVWLGELAGYLPRVLAAAAVLLLGVVAGNLLRTVVSSAASSAGFAYARPLGQMVRVAVVLVAAVVAIDELGIEVTFLTVVTATVLGAVLGGAALAFGLGARITVSNIVASHYLTRTYRIGHRVRIGEHEGLIADIQATAVILQTEGGRVLIPAREFSQQPSVLLDEDAQP